MLGSLGGVAKFVACLKGRLSPHDRELAASIMGEHVEKLALLVGRAAMVAMPKLTALDASKTQLGPEGAALLAAGLAHSPLASVKCAMPGPRASRPHARIRTHAHMQVTDALPLMQADASVDQRQQPVTLVGRGPWFALADWTTMLCATESTSVATASTP